jgi:glyoxylase-like metal-dependent hydrolase (beta-lactamase superfamily II)
MLSAQARTDTDLVKLADGVYVRISSPDSNAVSNAGVIILEHSTLVFDTHFTPEAGQALLAKIQAITPRPVRYIVNSHFHSDHTHGNQAFSRTQQIIASSNTRRDILQRDVPTMLRMIGIAQSQMEKINKDFLKAQDPAQKETLRRQIAARQEFIDRMSREKVIPPVFTFDDTLTIQDGAREVRLLYLGNGHTEGDVILFLPAERIVFAGDLFFNACLPSTQDAILLDWIRTLKEALKLEADRFVPGHGPVGERKDVEGFITYLEDLKAMVEPSVVRGDTLEQLVQSTQLPSKYSSYAFANFFPANLQKMYAELRAVHLVAGEESPGGAKKVEPDKAKP